MPSSLTDSTNNYLECLGQLLRLAFDNPAIEQLLILCYDSGNRSLYALIATGQCIKHTRVHEHVFISIRIEKDISIICSTCSSLL
jgi:hypothetical protein